MKSIAENVWLCAYPLKIVGADVRRNSTILRLTSGDLVIHSTAPFTAADVAEIHGRGHPRWLVEAMLDHDTFAKEGRAAFPNASYLAPAGFSERVDFPVGVVVPPPAEWDGELDVLSVEGVPSFQETVFFHRPSHTLITADLVFNFPCDEPVWTELLLRVAIGSEHRPGMSRRFKAAIKDRDAFESSMARMLSWEFDRVIVGHGEAIESGAKPKVVAMLRHAGFDVPGA